MSTQQPRPDGTPRDDDALARAFERERPRLLRVAYMTLGSLAEAEDCVQETWIRLRGVPDPTEIRDLAAWLTTTVGRQALNALRSARMRREHYVGTWLPEPVVEDLDVSAPNRDPADRITLDESVSMALLLVLENLSPAQRTAFLLHDVFGLSFAEVAEVVGRSPAAVRQLASRARHDVEHGSPRFPPNPAKQRELVAAFASACQNGDLERLVSLLDPGVVWRGDGGGKVSALPQVLRGVMEVARGWMSVGLPTGVREATVNGAPGLVMRDPAGVLTVIAFTFDSDRIAAIDVIRNPDKLIGVPDQS